MNFKENLRYLRRVNKMSQDTLADLLGYKSFTTVQKWEDGSAFPRVKQLNAMAKIFNVDVDHLLNIDLKASKVEVPILGEVKAGYDLYLNQDVIGYEYCESKDYKPGEFFYLKVKGDSMIDERIGNGDLVYVHAQDYISDNEIGVFLIDNDEVTIKKAKVNKNSITLKAANKKYQDRQFKKDEIKILGRVVYNKVSF